MTTLDAHAAFDPQYWQWGAGDPGPRFLHAMIRVSDLDTALRFYTDGFGMRVLGRFDVPLRRVSAAYIGYAGYDEGGLLELTHKWDGVEIVPGSFHFAIGVPQMDATLARLEAAGAVVELAPTVLVTGGPLVAFIKDLDGYSVELIQTRRA
jgi:lactoylglutathione lyase